MKTFRVIARAPASAIFRHGEVLQVNHDFDGIPICYQLQTRFVGNFSSPTPGDMLIIAEGEADDLKSAASNFINFGRDIAAAVALSANATIEPLEPEIVFEASPGQTSHEFFQRYVSADRLSLSSRFVDLKATAEIITSLSKNEERGRLTRAISQYFEALRYWRNGYELLALSHLFMGVEAMKTACWRHKIRTEGITKDELARDWGYQEDGRLNLKQSLNAASRVKLVFQGDSEAHRLAKETSDNFEHGFENAGKLHVPARLCLVATAKYLREAIVNILEISPESKRSILGKKFQRPRGPLGVDTYLFGYLLGDPENLAPDGSDFPYLEWKTDIEDVTFDKKEDRYSFQPNHKFTARIGEGVRLENIRFEMWDVSSFWPTEVTKTKDAKKES